MNTTSVLSPFRRLIYLSILIWLPLIFCAFYFWNQRTEWKRVASQVDRVHSLSCKKQQKQSVNAIVRNLYAESDTAYLTHQLESLVFLKRERESLEKLMHHPNFTSNEAAETRYAFLSNGKNRPLFSEESTQSAEGVHEMRTSLSHSVEIDAQDLKEILLRVEGSRPNKPLLMFTDFKITKKTHANGNEVFECVFSLLKREFFCE